MTSYVDLYQETLVQKIDRRNPFWVYPGIVCDREILGPPNFFFKKKCSTRHHLPPKNVERIILQYVDRFLAEFFLLLTYTNR